MRDSSRRMNAAELRGGSGQEAYIRLLVTRGVGELSYDPGVCPTSSLVVIVKPQVDPPPEAFERGVRVALVSTVRNHPGSVNPLIKSNNLLNNALAMQEASRTRRLRRGHAELPRRTCRVHHGQYFRRERPDERSRLRSTRACCRESRASSCSRLARRSARAGARGRCSRTKTCSARTKPSSPSTTREVVPIVQVDDRTDRLWNARAGHPEPCSRAFARRRRS